MIYKLSCLYLYIFLTCNYPSTTIKMTNSKYTSTIAYILVVLACGISLLATHTVISQNTDPEEETEPEITVEIETEDEESEEEQQDEEVDGEEEQEEGEETREDETPEHEADPAEIQEKIDNVRERIDTLEERAADAELKRKEMVALLKQQIEEVRGKIAVMVSEKEAAHDRVKQPLEEHVDMTETVAPILPTKKSSVHRSTHIASFPLNETVTDGAHVTITRSGKRKSMSADSSAVSYMHPETSETLTREEMVRYLRKKIAKTQMALKRLKAQQQQIAFDGRGGGLSVDVGQFERIAAATEQVDRDRLLLEIHKKIGKVESDIATLLKEKESREKESEKDKEKESDTPLVITKKKGGEIDKEAAITLTPRERDVKKEDTEGRVPAMILTLLIIIIILIIATPAIKRWKEQKKQKDMFDDKNQNNIFGGQNQNIFNDKKRDNLDGKKKEDTPNGERKEEKKEKDIFNP